MRVFLVGSLLGGTTDEQTGMHYALDETLATLDSGAACSGNAAFETAIKGPGMAALVLKPTLLGGFARCLSLHRRAPPGTEVVFLSLAGSLSMALARALSTLNSPAYTAHSVF